MLASNDEFCLEKEAFWKAVTCNDWPAINTDVFYKDFWIDFGDDGARCYNFYILICKGEY